MERTKTINIISFGFKYGFPNVNYFFDVSFIQNPARSGKWNLFDPINPEMMQYVLDQPGVAEFVGKAVNLILAVAELDDGLKVGFGCSGGRHRSPIIAQAVSDEIAKRSDRLLIEIYHRDQVKVKF